MTGEFDVCGDKFILIFQGQPNEEQERLFHAYLTEVWRRVPLTAREAILAEHPHPQIMIETRLTDFQIGGNDSTSCVAASESWS